jgi:hypothetical protein
MHPSSQIPFFTAKPLAEFGFEARQIRIIQTHPNSSKLPNLVIRMSQRTEYLVIWLFSYSGHPKNQIFGYLVIWLFGYLVIWLFGYSVIQLFGYSVIRLFGYSVIRLFGYPGQLNNNQIFGYSGHPKKTEATEFGMQ